MRTKLLRQARRWHRRRFRGELSRLAQGELEQVLTLARLFEGWPRRWWWVEEMDVLLGGAHDVAWVIGG